MGSSNPLPLRVPGVPAVDRDATGREAGRPGLSRSGGGCASAWDPGDGALPGHAIWRGAPGGRRWHNGGVSTTGQDLLEEFRRQRRAGDPRLTDSDKEILRRITMGDLADEFADSLAAISDADPLLGGGSDDDDD